MKKFILFLCVISSISIPTFCNSTNEFEIIDQTNLQVVIPINQSKEVIEKQLRKWITTNFTDETSTIRHIDSEMGSIRGKGNLVLKIRFIFEFAQNVIFDYQFDIKDNKLRWTLKNLYYNHIDTQTGIGSRNYFGRENEMRRLIESIPPYHHL